MKQKISRRELVKKIGIGGLALGAMASLDSAGKVLATESQPKPNILLIVAEDHGLQLSCYNDPVVKTPHLDNLASKGVRFTSAYITQAGCSPSRSSIFTGLYPHQNGQIGLATHRFTMHRDDFPNIPSLLHSDGYQTGVIGKIHVNPEKTFTWDFNENPTFNRFKNRDVAKVAQMAGDWMAGADKPFFLMVSYADSHKPFLRQDAGLPEHPLGPEDVKTLPFLGHESPDTLQTVADYYNCMSRLDTGVGMLLEQLNKTGKADNTMIIYLGDHGPDMARGKKTSYEGGVRVPVIMSFPGCIPENNVEDRLVSTVDFLPTILDAAGITHTIVLPGRSLLPLVNNSISSWREYLFTEYTVHMPSVYFPQRTVRDKRYKLINTLLPNRMNPVYKHYLIKRLPKHLIPEDLKTASKEVQKAYEIFHKPPEYELYDLKNDPWEFHNLSESPEHLKILEKMKSVLTQWQEETDDPFRHPENLRKFTSEIEQVYDFETGKYDDVRKKPDFRWEYTDYCYQNRGINE